MRVQQMLQIPVLWTWKVVSTENPDFSYFTVLNHKFCWEEREREKEAIRLVFQFLASR